MMHINYFQFLWCTVVQRSLFRTKNFITVSYINNCRDSQIVSFEIILFCTPRFIYFAPLKLKLLLRQF